MYYDFVMIVSMGFFLMRLSIIWFHTNASTRLLIGSTANAFVLNYMSIFICSLFKCIMLLKIAFMVIELAKEISFQADPLPQIYYFHCNKQNWDIPLFKACLLYYILRFFPRESLAVLGGGKMNLFCAIILHLVIIRR